MSSLDPMVGYLFSDIEGSTERWEKAPARMQVVLAQHDALIDEIVARHGGVIQDRAGDGVFATFAAGNPLDCALDIQLEMQRRDWSAVGGLYLRVGVHAGRAEAGVTNRAAINRAARIMSSGWGGQIVVSGAASEAYAAPPGATLADLGVCHFKGIDEPLRLSGLIHSDLARTEFPPLRSLQVQSAAGPDVASPIFGRQQEIRDVLAHIASERLVTIVGAAGNGKTRLAAQIGAEQAARRPVCFVSLQSASSNAEIVSAVARALRFPFHGAVRPEDQLVDYLRDKTTLLMLDNAEACAGDAACVSGIMATCPAVSVLITSREPLRVPGEVVFRLAGIALPSKDPAKAKRSAAMQLFLHEARQKDAKFAIADRQIEMFHQICDRVDGSPLALRLTAQWVHLLSLEETLERLQSGLDFLSSGQSDARQTLRSVFEGSWKLLSAEQRQALARLSVFAKAFDWPAAASVTKVDLEDFAALERKGLLEQTVSRRFVMHPLVREYARAKLAETPSDEVATRQRHATHYLGAVCDGFQHLAERGQNAVLEALQRDFPEIRVAWFHAVDTRAKALILKSIEPLCYALYTRSMFREALDVFGAHIEDESLQRYFTSIHANFLIHQGDAKGAATAAASVLAAPGGARGARAHAHHTLGNLAQIRGDFSQARMHYERTYAIREKTGDLMGCAYASLSLGTLYLMFGKPEEARGYVKSGYRVARQIGDTFGMMASHIYAGDIAVSERRLDDAQANYEKGLRLQDSVPHMQFRSNLLRRLGSLFVLRGDFENALKQHRDAHDLARDMGDQRLRAQSLIEIGAILRRMDEFEEAKASLLRGVRLSIALTMQPTLARGLLELAEVELRLDRHDVARRLLTVLDSADLGELQAHHAALVAELEGGEPASAAPTTVQDLLNELIAEAEVDSLRL